MDNKNLKDWNQKGLIPGPLEEKKAYLERVEVSLQSCENLSRELPDLKDTKSYLEEAMPITQSIAGIAPDWVPLLFSNEKLAFWHGGCAWFYQQDDKSPTSCFLQLRKEFLKSKRIFFGLYDRSELIAHELMHVGRMEFKESRFEEIFAYKTSSSKFQKLIGPIVCSAKESFLFILVLAALIFFDLSMLFLDANLLDWWIITFHSMPVLIVVAAFIRLFFRHHQLTNTYNILRSFIDNDQTTWAFLYRLSDDEIVLFGKLKPNQILEWIEREKKHSFRWQFLYNLYVSKEQN